MHFSTPFALLAFTASVLAQDKTITVSAPVSTSSTYTDDSTFEDDMLKAHNFFRKEHNATDLKWNDTSARFASKWADGCEFEHSGGPTGENLAIGYQNATANVDAWALERTKYSWKDPGFDEETGHFTALVWRNTTSVGCGRTNCDGQNDIHGWLVVCEYYPPGNVVGADGQYFKDNVLEQVEGKETDTVESGVTSAGSGWNDARWGMGVFLAAGCVVMGIGF